MYTVKEIQHALDVPTTGQWDDLSISAMKNFQYMANCKNKNGLIDDDSVNKLMSRVTSNYAVQDDIDDCPYTTDLSESTLNIIQKILPNGEYCTDSVTCKYIFLHHTSGWDSPYATVDDWAKDKRGRIGTHYVIGGKINNKKQYDGVIVQCIPLGNWAYHLGSQSQHGINLKMQMNSIGIELCNFGYLTKKAGKYYTYTNTEVDKSDVIDLGYKFRGYQYWHNYSDHQIESLRLLLIYLIDQFKLPKTGLLEWINSSSPESAFDFNKNSLSGNVHGILSHGNVRKDKTDIYPHPKLIEMLKSIKFV
jgi:N-acetyl-anhydromuramyl-L-alanine amidase AmpD